ncbi:MAG: hypothetical protein IKG93_07410 [Clostridiales bacterium]|nr:hypothetical protein [Clostridiales bacterium]
MLNLYKMHLYRASKATSTLVIGILLGVFLIMNSLLAAFLFDDSMIMNLLGVTVEGTLSGDVYPATVQIFHVNTSDAFNILITIFAVIFAHSDYSKGFIKNTYSLFEEKWKFDLAKWTSMITVVSGIYFAYSFLAVSSNTLLIRTVSASEWGEYFRVLFVSYLCFVAFVTMTYLITSLFKSAAGGMVIGIIIASGLLQTIEKLLDLLIAKLSGAHLEEMVMNAVGVGSKSYFKISDYCLDNVYLSYGANSSTGDTVRTVIVALVYTALGLGLVMLFHRKKDIR